MNYTIVLNGALWLGASLYYALYARKYFRGPHSTMQEEPEGDDKEVVEDDST